MSRFRNAARSLTSGYAALAANGVYLLASVPLALRYLSFDEFAVWNIVVLIAGYLTLIDLGMTGAVSRILIDHKDDKQGIYGSVITTGTLVLLVQGTFIVLGGLLLSAVLPALVDVPPLLINISKILIFGQCLLLGLFFPIRILANMLQAHQRFDVINYAQIVQLFAGFVTQWLTFHLGWGLYSLLAASAISALVSLAHNLIWVFKLHLFPVGRGWGRPSSKIFAEIFAFGKDLFLLSVGLQLLNASQGVIIARTLGLTSVTVWAVATKSFLLAQQVVARISDFSSSALGEMVVRGERDRLKRRFRELLLLTGSAGVLVGLALALCNGSFIAVWLKGGSRVISENDVTNHLQSFTAKLSDQEEPVSRYLWSQLSPSTRDAIRSDAPPAAITSILIRDLNQIIRTNSLYHPERFAGVVLSSETRSLLGRELRGGWLARFNRLLLEDAFPKEIERSIRFSTDWPWVNDVLLGLLLLVTSVTRIHISLTGQTKQIGAMRFVYFLEGISFVIAACLVAPHWGMAGIIVAAIVANIVWSGAYGFWRTALYFGVPLSEPLFAWLLPAFYYFLVMAPITVVLGWCTSGLFAVNRFFFCGAALFVIGAGLLWPVGLTSELRLELKHRFESIFPSKKSKEKAG
jgi:O-antigen/teichoic acid export membrane protein